jgi:flagellar FliL protein
MACGIFRAARLIWPPACLSQCAMENENEKVANGSARGGPPIITIVLVAIMAAGGAGGGVYFFVKRSVRSTVVKAVSAHAEDNVKDVFPLDQFVVNLADSDHASFLRLGLELGLSKKLPSGEGEKSSRFVPQVRDVILTVVTSFQSSQLLAPEGKKKLKEQILEVLRKKVPDLHVAEVYFTDFIVQQ